MQLLLCALTASCSLTRRLSAGLHSHVVIARPSGKASQTKGRIDTRVYVCVGMCVLGMCVAVIVLSGVLKGESIKGLL